MTLEDKVTEIIVEKLGVDGRDIRGETSFVDDLGADSLDMIEMVMAFEEEFGIQISDDDTERLTTVRDLVECMRSKHPEACRKYT